MSTLDKFDPIKAIDTREGIFRRTFRIRIPYIETLSVEEIKLHGMPYTGDRQLDEAVARDIVDRYYTIDQMVDLMRRGVMIRVPKYDDTKAIYECIQAHLEAWKNEMLMRSDVYYAPIDDLIDLDKLAAIVYDKAKYVFRSHDAGDFVTRRFDQLFEGFIPSADFTPDLNGEPQEYAQKDFGDDGLGKHNSLENLFLSRITNR